MRLNIKPEDYIKNALKTASPGDIRKISEDCVKKLEDRRVCKNKMDFITDDFPNMQNIMDTRNSRLSPFLLKEMEKEYGPNGRNYVETYNKNLRRQYAFWTKVLKLIKQKEK